MFSGIFRQFTGTVTDWLAWTDLPDLVWLNLVSDVFYGQSPDHRLPLVPFSATQQMLICHLSVSTDNSDATSLVGGHETIAEA